MVEYDEIYLARGVNKFGHKIFTFALRKLGVSWSV